MGQDKRQDTRVNKGGRPRKVQSAAEINRVAGEYFAECEQSGKVPLYEEILVRLGISGKTGQRYTDIRPDDGDNQEDIDNKLEVMAALKSAAARCAASLCRAGISDKSAQTMAIFLLKQQHYGGYTDRPIDDGRTINITVQGGDLKRLGS